MLTCVSATRLVGINNRRALPFVDHWYSATANPLLTYSITTFTSSVTSNILANSYRGVDYDVGHVGGYVNGCI